MEPDSSWSPQLISENTPQMMLKTSYIGLSLLKVFVIAVMWVSHVEKKKHTYYINSYTGKPTVNALTGN